MNPSIRKSTNENIKKFGLSVIGVFGGVPFTYSIGARKINQPDIFLPYLNFEIATYFINSVFKIMKNGGVKESCIIEGLAQNDLSLGLVKADLPFMPFLQNNFTIQAGQYYKTENYELYQVVIPDKNNKFPWENGYEEFIKDGNGQKLYFYKDKALNLPRIQASDYQNDKYL